MSEKETRFTLTGNDIALALEASALAVTSYYERSERPFTDFVKERIAAHKDLIAKLSAVSDYAYPYQCSDDMPLDCGDEPIMTMDLRVTNKTRKAAANALGETP